MQNNLTIAEELFGSQAGLCVVVLVLPTVRGSQFAVASGDLSKVLWTTWEAGASIYTLIAAALWGHAEEVRCWVEGMLMFLVSFWDEMLRQRRDEFRGLNYCSLTMRGSFFFLKKGSCFVRFKNKCKASHPKMLLFLFNDSDYQRVLMGKRRSCIIAWSGFNCSVGERERERERED